MTDYLLVCQAEVQMKTLFFQCIAGLRLITLSMTLSMVSHYAYADSNIVLDGSTGTSTIITSSPLGAGTQYTIDTANGTVNGANLFFSFKDFGITSTDTVLFQCSTGCIPASISPPIDGSVTAGISNVIARVNGINPSIIDGRLISNIGQITVTYPNFYPSTTAPSSYTYTPANFWIFNPNGVTFNNTNYDIGGATFGVSTKGKLNIGDKANRVIFTDGAEFGLTTSPSSSTLTVVAGTANNAVSTPNLPVSFGFPPPPTITITPTPEPTPTTPTTQVEIVPVPSVPEPTVVIISEPEEPRNIDAVLVKPILPVSVPTPPDKLKPCASHAKSSLINKSVANYQPKHSVQVPYGLSDKTINTLSSQTASGSESSTECHENNP